MYGLKSSGRDGGTPIDLKLAMLLAVLSIPATALPALEQTLPRYVLALPLVLFLPGWSLVSFLFPSSRDLKAADRVALSFALSLSATALAGLLLAYSFGLSLFYIVLTLSAFTLTASLLARGRRTDLPPGERFECGLRMPEGGASSLLFRALFLCALLLMVYVSIAPRDFEGYTELYLLDPSGGSMDYPKHVPAGEEGKVSFAVVNRENRPMNYRLVATLGNRTLSETGLELARDGKAERTYTFTKENGESEKLEFALYVRGDDVPYRTVYLWVDA